MGRPGLGSHSIVHTVWPPSLAVAMMRCVYSVSSSVDFARSLYEKSEPIQDCAIMLAGSWMTWLSLGLNTQVPVESLSVALPASLGGARKRTSASVSPRVKD